MATRKSRSALARFLFTRGVWLIIVEIFIVATLASFSPGGIPEAGVRVARRRQCGADGDEKEPERSGAIPLHTRSVAHHCRDFHCRHLGLLLTRRDPPSPRAGRERGVWGKR